MDVNCKSNRNLVFHHLNPDVKEFRVSSRAFQFTWSRVKTEILKCIFICHNCHGEVHDGLIETSIITEKHRELVGIIGSLDFWPDEKRLVRVRKEKQIKPRKTKIDWPSSRSISEMLGVASFEAVARKLDVSSNAIRKRLRNHSE